MSAPAGAARSVPGEPVHGRMPWRDAVASGALTMASVLVAFGAVVGLGRLVPLPASSPVLVVVLTLMLGRALDRSPHDSALAIVEVPLLGVVATCAGWLLVAVPWIGQPLLVVALSAGVLARRATGPLRQLGRFVSLPFLAVLVTPVPAVAVGDLISPAGLVGGAVVGLIAVLCALAAQRLGGRVAPAAASAPPRRTPSRRSVASAALQLLLALSAALVAGHLLFGDRWVWPLLSAYLVLAGARGRGDVLHKAGLRVVGALAGTATATLLTTHVLPAGDPWIVVAIFAVLAVAVVLRRRSYAWWAAGVTAMLALLAGYAGRTDAAALPERLLGVALGCALGVAAAWLVLPIRTADVLRGRLADCLAALTDDLAPQDPDAAPAAPGLPAALRRLDELAPALRAHRRVAGRRDDPHPLDGIAAMHRLATIPDDNDDAAAARRRLRRDVVRVRRAIVGRDDPDPADLPPDLATVHRVIQATRVGDPRRRQDGEPRVAG